MLSTFKTKAIAISKKNHIFALRYKTQQGWGNSFSAKPSPRAPPLGKHPLCFLEANHRDAIWHPFIFPKQCTIQLSTPAEIRGLDRAKTYPNTTFRAYFHTTICCSKKTLVPSADKDIISLAIFLVIAKMFITLSRHD